MREKILEKQHYHCCFGPKDNSANVPSDAASQVLEKGQRRKRTEFGEGIKRGCQACLTVVIYKARPTEVEIRQGFVTVLCKLQILNLHVSIPVPTGHLYLLYLEQRLHILLLSD